MATESYKPVTKQLNPTLRRNIALAFDRGIPPRQIAEKQGISVNKVMAYINENHTRNA